MNKGSFKTKFKALVFPTFYLLIALFLSISSYSLFEKKFYLPVYIDGESMKPTLNNEMTSRYEGSTKIIENTHFGYVDQSKQAKSEIKRFDIITTYYKEDYSNGVLKDNASYKIKRIIALPNETFKIEQSILYTYENNEWVKQDFTFTHNTGNRDVSEKTLGDNQYWVLGDNWSNSKDSSNPSVGAIEANYITGVLVAIEGTCTVKEKDGKQTFENYNYYSRPVFYL